MKTVYFDTYVYNKLENDKRMLNEIIKLKNAKKIEIIFSDYIFSELVCVLRSSNLESRRKGKHFFEVVLELRSKKVLKQRETLINEEIKAFLDNKPKPDIFLDKNKTILFFDTVRRLGRNEKITNDAPIHKFMEDKRSDHIKIKDIIKKEYFSGLKETVHFNTFEEFYDAKGKSEDTFIEELLSTNMKISNPEAINKIKENRHNLLHFNAYLRMSAAYQYALIVEKKPDRGDMVDKKHFESAASLDLLVCDQKFLNILKWTYPQKCCLSLNQFLTYFSNN